MSDPEKVIVVFLSDRNREECEETEALVRSAGGEVVATLFQKRVHPDPVTFIGKGKLAELKKKVEETGASLVLFDTFLKVSQYNHLTDFLGVKVIDRAGLILDIFAQRAKTDLAKLQVELAQLSYLLLRLRGKGLELSRTAGGIGTRGPGEKKLETDRRRIRERIKKIREKIREIERTREIQRKRRKDRHLFVVSLVGYTNAGKSTLFNALTRKNRATGNHLFLTLDTKFSRIYLDGIPVVVSDTIGIIRNLPPFLIKAFEATLEEVKESSVIIKVLDASDPEVEEKLEIVENVLRDIGAEKIPDIFVLNKVDIIDEGRKEYLRWVFKKRGEPIFISALKGEGIDALKAKMKEYLLCEV